MWPDSCATLFDEPDADMSARFRQRNYAKFTTTQFATPWLTLAIYPWSFFVRFDVATSTWICARPKLLPIYFLCGC